MKLRKQKVFNRHIIFVAIPILLLVGLYSLISNLTQAQDQPIAQTQSGSSSGDLNLSFGQSGKISKIYVQNGDIIKKGNLLMELDKSDLVNQLNYVKSNIKLQQSQLENLKAQSTNTETLILNEIKLENAQFVVSNALDDLIITIQDAYTKAEDGVRGKADQLFANPAYSYSQLSFNIPDSQLQQSVRTKRTVVESALIAWKATLDALDSNSDIDAYIISAKGNLKQIKDFLDTAALAVNSTADTTINSTTLRNWKLDVFAARSNVNTAFKNILTSLGSLKAARGNLKLLQRTELTLKNSDASKQIEALSNSLTDYQNKEQLLQDKINKTILISPVDGIVTKQNGRVGMTVSAPFVVVSIIISR